MNLRNLENLPVLLESSVIEIGKVSKAVIGDDFRVAYLVIDAYKIGPGIILRDEFTLWQESVFIRDLDCIKSYAHGEESSIYEKKIGDKVFDLEGKELGILSDFVINRDNKEVRGVELSSGILQDILDGRAEIPINAVKWVSPASATVKQKGRDV